MMHDNQKTWTERTRDWFLDLLFPKNALVREIETLSSTDFMQKISETSEISISQLIDVGLQKDDVSFLFPYRNEYVHIAIWNIKYKGNVKMAKLLATFLADRIARTYQNFTIKPSADKNDENIPEVLIIPIPISAKRKKERGFNQIELLLSQLVIPEALQKHVDIRTDILAKEKHTDPQTSLTNRKERLKNLADSFGVMKPEDVCGKIIILVDDVLTTGSTLAEAEKVLLEACALDIVKITLAH